jgi:hypothetical protein
VTIQHSVNSREDFINSFLIESPVRAIVPNGYQTMKNNIEESLEFGAIKRHVKDNLFKIIGNSISFYWYEENNEIILGTELTVRPLILTVNLTGKNPAYKGRPPFASILYDAIIKDSNKPIKLESDSQLTDEGLSIWKKLIHLGHTVSVYDVNNATSTIQVLKSPTELDQFFGTSNDFSKYRYVLSESGPMTAETKYHFNLRRYRELAGIL